MAKHLHRAQSRANRGMQGANREQRLGVAACRSVRVGRGDEANDAIVLHGFGGGSVGFIYNV